VMLVRPQAVAEVSAISRVLVPLDGERATATALRPASALVTRLSAAMDALVVVHPHQDAAATGGGMSAPRYVDQPHHEWPQWAAEVRDRFLTHCAELPRGGQIGVYIRQGEPAAEIVRFASVRSYDAILLSRTGRLHLGGATTLRAVLEATRLPVFLTGTALD
jgi:hypothetical protein